MRIDPIIAGLRGDPAPQHLAQRRMVAAKDEWRNSPTNARLSEQLAAFDKGGELAEFAALDELVSDEAAARNFADSFLGAFLDLQREEALGHIPFRHSSNDRSGTMIVMRAGRSALQLCCYEPGDWPATGAAFSDTERHEIILAGEGEARRYKRPCAADTCVQNGAEKLQAGTLLTVPAYDESVLVSAVKTRLVTLRILRPNRPSRPALEYRIEDAQLSHQAAGEPRESRYELMAALLARMGHEQAPNVLAEMTLHGSDHLRWQALRECIALDTATGFAALCTLAASPKDTLAGHAAKLRDQLVAAHPALAQLEGEPCPA